MLNQSGSSIRENLTQVIRKIMWVFTWYYCILSLLIWRDIIFWRRLWGVNNYFFLIYSLYYFEVVWFGFKVRYFMWWVVSWITWLKQRGWSQKTGDYLLHLAIFLQYRPLRNCIDIDIKQIFPSTNFSWN